ncbi:hypothetical protein LINPERPRIM_LOCUS18235 [Linum perenne]
MPTCMPNHPTRAPNRARAVWQRCLASAFRTALACTIVGCTTLYGPQEIQRHVAFPAFSYVTVILIVTDATLGDSLRACWLSLYATVQTVCPAVVIFWMVGPGRFSAATISLAVAVNAFAVALPVGTHIVAKRIALGQIVIIYVVGYIKGDSLRTVSVMHPVHVAASTAVGVVACVKKNCKFAAENASERLKLYVKAFSANDNASASASLTRAKTLASAGTKFLNKIKLHQESTRWETFPMILLGKNRPISPVPKLQEIEMLLRGMELALSSSSSSPRFSHGSESKQSLQLLQEHISRSLKQIIRSSSSSSDSSPTVPESTADNLTNSLQKLIRTFPTNRSDLPHFFFWHCIKHLHCISSPTSKPAAVGQKIEGSSAGNAQMNDVGFIRSVWLSMSIGIGTENRVLPAFKCSVSLGLAVMFGLMYSKENGYWSGLPVAISLAAAAREATFTVTNVKAQGTVLGTVYGVLGCFVFERFLPVRFMSLLPWFVVTSFLRRNRMYGQAGGISAVIGAILILGRKNFGQPSEFAIARIIETFIGLSCSIFVDLLFQPTRASSLAKIELADCFAALGSCVDCLSLKENTATGLIDNHKQLKSNVEELRKLIGEAELEPNFWFIPFPSSCYGKLLISLSNMADMLLFSAQLGLGFTGNQISVFGEVDGEIEIFKDAIGPLVKCFEDVTKLKYSLKMLDEELEKEKKSIEYDLESGKFPNRKAYEVLNSSHGDDEKKDIVDRYLERVKEVAEEGIEEGGDGKEMVMLRLGGVGFCVNGLIREVKEVGRCINELVQLENPTCNVNLLEVACKIDALCS